MATYAVSDLHGCKQEFDALLETIHFSAYDDLYIIGDVCDRGSNPIPLYRQIMQTPNMHLIFGNHDSWFTHYIPDLIEEKRFPGTMKMTDDLFRWVHRNGGITTLDQFLDLPLPECYDLQAFLDRPVYYKTLQIARSRFLLVHAGFKEHCTAGINPAEVSPDELIWSHIGLDDNPFPDTWLVVGHMPTFCYGAAYENRIIVRPHSKLLHIDCGCVFGRSLGCIRLNDFTEFYVPSTYRYLPFEG